MKVPGRNGSRSPGEAAGARPSQGTRTTFSGRIFCSFKALGVAWLITGTIFCIVVKGPSTISFWCIWGSLVFAVGWLLVGLPLVALGEWARRVPFLVLTLAGGLGGALVMYLPTIIFGFYLQPGTHWKYSLDSLKWEGLAFVIAALTTALYYRFLHHEAGD
jgi:hypothetical protein